VYHLLGCNDLQFGENSTVRRNLSPPASGSKSNQRINQQESGGKLRRQRLTVSCLAYSSTLKIEAISYSEESSSLSTTRHYSPEDSALHGLNWLRAEPMARFF
jgi:hypothetical protein